MILRAARCLALVAVSIWTPAPAGAAGAGGPIEAAVDEIVRPLMDKHGVPGMAVGIVTPAERHVFTYGIASRETGKPVTAETLFEIGSISKTFTALLAAYAKGEGKLALSDSASAHFPALAGTAFDKVSLLNLATHTPGGLPLQFPAKVRNDEQMLAYFKAWKPAYASGTYRTYSNPGIGLLGLIAARSMGEDFDVLMENRLYPALGLTHTYLNLPEDKRAAYAQGYTKDNRPVRLTPGVLGAEAYGVRTTAGDLVHFVEANMGRLALDAKLQEAISATHAGYFRLGKMTQALIWESYAYPVALDDLLAGSSRQVVFNANPVEAIEPPRAPEGSVLIHKTGSTNGFGAYAAFVPEKGIGVVLLANRNYPIEARLTAAHRILEKLGAP